MSGLCNLVEEERRLAAATAYVERTRTEVGEVLAASDEDAGVLLATVLLDGLLVALAFNDARRLVRSLEGFGRAIGGVLAQVTQTIEVREQMVDVVLVGISQGCEAVRAESRADWGAA